MTTKKLSVSKDNQATSEAEAITFLQKLEGQVLNLESQVERAKAGFHEAKGALTFAKQTLDEYKKEK